MDKKTEERKMKRPGLDVGINILSKIKNPIMIDVGAYIGKVTRLCKEANPAIISYAIEPDPTNYEILIDNLKENCYNCAIAGENGTMVLYVTNRKEIPGTSESNTLFRKVLKDKKKRGKKIGAIKNIQVQTYTMDSFIDQFVKKDKIDFIKMNCEGGEYDIFDGTPEFLNITDMIYVSFHAQNKPFNTNEFLGKRYKAYALLESKGFELIAGIGKNADKKHIWQLWRKNDSSI